MGPQGSPSSEGLFEAQGMFGLPFLRDLGFGTDSWEEQAFNHGTTIWGGVDTAGSLNSWNEVPLLA